MWKEEREEEGCDVVVRGLVTVVGAVSFDLSKEFVVNLEEKKREVLTARRNSMLYSS